MITDVDLLTEPECREICSVVYDLKDLWIQRHPVAPFYTLGASHYWDIPLNPQPRYYEMAKQYNRILRDRLGWLYERLADTLAEHLKAPVGYRDTLGLPGFHIFLAHSAFKQMQDLTNQEWLHSRHNPDIVASPIHCDTAHLLVNWGTKDGIDFSNPISFTLAIGLPKSGGGLYVWDLYLKEAQGLSKEEFLDRIDARNRKLYSYTVGQLALHSGLMFHQVASMPNIEMDDERITLQGHGLMCHGVWQLYW